MRTKGALTLRKELDRLFSLYIRQRSADQNGTVQCYTCPKTDHWKKMQNGHFVPRQYLATRYDEMNCQVQCYACNMLYNGQPSVFARNLNRDFGKGTTLDLEKLRQKIIPNFPYEEYIEIYKEKVAEFA